jgi:hypothetical protein
MCDVRLYLMDSPVVRADTLCFRAQGVREVVRFGPVLCCCCCSFFFSLGTFYLFVCRVVFGFRRFERRLTNSDVFRPWFNGYRYFVQMATAYTYQDTQHNSFVQSVTNTLF